MPTPDPAGPAPDPQERLAKRLIDEWWNTKGDGSVAEREAWPVINAARDALVRLEAALAALRAERDEAQRQTRELVKLEAAYRENEQSMLRQLSDALTDGNASTWEEVVDSARARLAVPPQDQAQVGSKLGRLALPAWQPDLIDDIKDFLVLVVQDAGNLTWRKRVATELFDKLQAALPPPPAAAQAMTVQEWSQEVQTNQDAITGGITRQLLPPAAEGEHVPHCHCERCQPGLMSLKDDLTPLANVNEMGTGNIK